MKNNNNIRKIRMSRNLTQMQLSHRSGVQQTRISGYENGIVPLVTTALQIARALRTSVESIWPFPGKAGLQNKARAAARRKGMAA